MSSIKIRTLPNGEYTEVRVLITHLMENGRNRDHNGELIPAHYIETLSISHNTTTVMTINMAGSMAKDPFFSFRLKSLIAGDTITVSWVDNLKLSDSAELRLTEAKSPPPDS